MSVPVSKRNVKPTEKTRMFYAVDQARKLAAHTVTICSNPNVFDPKFAMITETIIQTVMDIYKKAYAANKIIVLNRALWIRRRNLQLEAINGCESLIALIDFAKVLYHIKGSKIKYWTEMTRKTKGYLTDWSSTDSTRYSLYV